MAILDEGRAQVASLIGATPTATEFLAVAIGRGGSTLTADMNNTQTTVPVSELACYPTSGTVKIDQEEISYTGRSGSSGSGNLTGATRGANSTTAAAHSSGNLVTLLAAATQSQLSNEIITGGGSRRSSPASTRTGGADTNVTRSRVTTTVTNDTARFDTTFTFTAAFGVAEVAVVNDGTVPATATTKQGTYLFRQTFAVINVASGDTLRIIADVKVA